MPCGTLTVGGPHPLHPSSEVTGFHGPWSSNQVDDGVGTLRFAHPTRLRVHSGDRRRAERLWVIERVKPGMDLDATAHPRVAPGLRMALVARCATSRAPTRYRPHPQACSVQRDDDRHP